MEELFAKGFAHELNKEDIQLAEKVWYLPHFHSFNLKKRDKVRLVWDAKAKTEGRSLNSFLLTGPDLYQPLPTVLVKFRQYRYGIAADIQDMFPRIRIRFQDTAAQRFLWRGMDRSITPKEYVMHSMIFGASCSPASAMYVKNKNAEEFQQQFPEASSAIRTNFYMDDYLDSLTNSEDVIRRIHEIIEVNQRGGFTIRNWICTDPSLLLHIPEGLRAQEKNYTLTESYTERKLGLYWDPAVDVFTFTKMLVQVRKELISGEKLPTKREILKILMSIFDPLGFVSNFTVRAKTILQDVWRSGIGWDDELPSTLLDQWRRWLQDLERISEVKIPRCYEVSIESCHDIQLHIFIDASEKAFGAVAYFRFSFEERVSLSLVMARSRVAPLRPMSIPRLELQGALMGSRLAVTIRESHNLNISSTHFWTDSRTVLCWIRSDARNFKQFVAHRVGEIEENSQGCTWKWIPTKENVADEATRTSYSIDFSPKARWFSGPDFLLQKETEWPTEPVKMSEGDQEKMELKGDFMGLVNPSPKVIEFSRFSSWNRLLRTMSWVRRMSKKKQERSSTVLSVQELQEAEIHLLRLIQAETFPEELCALKKRRSISKSSKLDSLSPHLAFDGVIRMRGRISQSPDLSADCIAPALLDPTHPAVKILILHYHQIYHHCGQETVTLALHQRYWILTARSAVRKAFFNCPKCQVNKARPVRQEMGLLPKARVTRPPHPFYETGIDYFGPMQVAIGRRREKRWGVLFTCLSTRAVHLELASSLTADSALMAIDRMISRRWKPRRIYSDNGTNFVGAGNEIKAALKEMDDDEVKLRLSTKEIDWRYIPPSGPHMGGSWERLVHSVKTALRSVLKEKAPSEETLLTLLIQVENVINSRPLTHISTDAKDEDPLTPNHFLKGQPSDYKLPGQFTKNDLCSRHQWRLVQAMANQFWSRWLKEYLPTLARRCKWNQPGPQLKIGDFVFIADGILPRGQWPRGLITATFPGKDGQVRVVEVKTQQGIFRRPIAKLMVPCSQDSRVDFRHQGGGMSQRP